MTQEPPLGASPAPEAPSSPSDNARLESLMAEMPPSAPGWSAPPSRAPTIALGLSLAGFAASLLAAFQAAAARQSRDGVAAGSLLFVVLLGGVVMAIVAITIAIRVRSSADSDTSARLRAAIAIGLSAVAIVLATIAGIDLYGIGRSEL